MGTDKEDFIELTERIGRKTGGVGVSPFTSDIRGQDDPAAYLVIRGKAVADKVGDLTDLFIDILHNAKLDDQARFKQVLAPTAQLLSDNAWFLHCPMSLERNSNRESWSDLAYRIYILDLDPAFSHCQYQSSQAMHRQLSLMV